jgi:uncharacterized PurR-regulated membrane protein YhhQ (DUF165 family)
VRRSSYGFVLVLAFVACVPAANWMIGHAGRCGEHGPCTITVAPGIAAPSGVLVIGLAFVLRDLVQRRLGFAWGAVAIVLGTIVSFAIVSKPLAAASISSYVASEAADLLVFTALQRRGLILAIVCSGAVSAALDSVLFVLLAFGDLTYFPGQLIGKLEAIAVALPFVKLLRRSPAVP